MANQAPCTVPELLLKLVLTGNLAHFSNPTLVDDKRLEHLLQAGKQVIYKSHQESETRRHLGISPNVWIGLTEVFSKAVIHLEESCLSRNGHGEGSSGTTSDPDLIAANYFSLVKDIERLNDLCTIARNLQATTKKTQNLAAEKGFDQQILKLIDICVRVTAGGFDDRDSSERNQERWQKVANLFKRLLITCLQFLHNFIQHNEQRKLVLWLDLFGNSGSKEQKPSNQVPQPPSQAPQDSDQPTTTAQLQALLGKMTTDNDPAAQEAREARIKATAENLPEGNQLTEDGGLGYNIDDVHALFDLMNTANEPGDDTKQAARVLMDKIRNDMERLSGLNVNQLDGDPEALLKVGAVLRAQLPEKDFPRTRRSPSLTQQESTTTNNAVASGSQTKATTSVDLPDIKSYGDAAASLEITQDDMAMPSSSKSAADILQEAKNELMARLHETTPMVGGDGDLYDLNGAEDSLLEDDLLDSAEGSLEDEDDEADDYQSPADPELERGLLTNVPLVLDKNEIEPLPMIIQAGIVDNHGSKSSHGEGVKNMQAVRCHILLAQEAGRNLLRELLIFIAAWDVPEHEIYFKLMMQIMEAILKNGLMSHAYSDFLQDKDIISPAQAVVIKLLTHIFRNKYSPTSPSRNSDIAPLKPHIVASLSRVDVLTVRYIFTVFRGNIIPETCALIYLQGQIRAGHALAEDFPLNLWDMERVYEGVYQFLEFFAVLTENKDWKNVLVEWELAYDLCTLIKELDASIPRDPRLPSHSSTSNHIETSNILDSDTPAIAPERPYSPLDAHHSQAPIQSPSSPVLSADPRDDPSPPPTEPSNFTWSNLKKLIILVMSSLVWNSTAAQNQIRVHGGIEPILQCTLFDANNLYIKEHAVVCLRFLLEGNAENQKIVRELESRGLSQEKNYTTTASKAREMSLAEAAVAVPQARTPLGRSTATSTITNSAPTPSQSVPTMQPSTTTPQPHQTSRTTAQSSTREQAQATTISLLQDLETNLHEILQEVERRGGMASSDADGDKETGGIVEEIE